MQTRANKTSYKFNIFLKIMKENKAPCLTDNK